MLVDSNSSFFYAARQYLVFPDLIQILGDEPLPSPGRKYLPFKWNALGGERRQITVHGIVGEIKNKIIIRHDAMFTRCQGISHSSPLGRPRRKEDAGRSAPLLG